MAIPKLYGLEFGILPAVALPYLWVATDFTVPAVLINNAVITAVCAGAAWYRSKQIAAEMGRRYRDRLDPMWPYLVAILLGFLAALQIILGVAHLSYYRKGHLVSDIFDQ
eukprot:CAMPEP_0174834842 /NCGR_PEP_ID=MMETSP1114-20130205/5079_1 /TAXON_ID=312471 /ORGANISM="Neobodo designis, Strain CCAP 1951/1" /LENGTH=109 /DNA_ID=CAMNT_0016068771 /DNA_START=75 /DNA_END=404 /DNA_ORIENTATION=-